MSEYTFETAALKAVTIDAVKYNEEGLKNSLTPEAIQAVVPMAWGGLNVQAKEDNKSLAVAVGDGAYVAAEGVALGYKAKAHNWNGTAIGFAADIKGERSIVLTGRGGMVLKPLAITIGSNIYETTPDGNVWRTCTTEGTGSITIGAGANTLNTTKTVDGVDTVMESSNAVTIGCKALNQSADSVVIGAQAQALVTPSIAIGVKSKVSGAGGISIGKGSWALNDSVHIGNGGTTEADSIAVGTASGAKYKGVALGRGANTSSTCCTAIGYYASVNDYGATVIRSTAEDGTYTQLYFSGANTPLAKKYFPTAWEQKQDVDPETGDPLFDDDGNPVMVDDPEKPIAGEAMMGFVAKDSAGNIIARGANMLSALFPYYTGEDDDPFQPTGMSLRGGEKPEPIAFHPSDLDMVEEEMEVEEPGATEPTKPFVYKPLPVYPIVEPEIEEINE